MTLSDEDNPLDFNATTTKEAIEETLNLSAFDKAHIDKHAKANEARRAYAKSKPGNEEALKPYQFKKGHSGNVHGKRTAWAFYEARVRNLTPEILDRLIEILKTGKDKDSLHAAELLLERAWGKAIEQVQVTSTGNQVPIINISIGGEAQVTRTIDCTPKLEPKTIEAETIKALPDKL